MESFCRERSSGCLRSPTLRLLSGLSAQPFLGYLASNGELTIRATLEKYNERDVRRNKGGRGVRERGNFQHRPLERSSGCEWTAKVFVSSVGKAWSDLPGKGQESPQKSPPLLARPSSPNSHLPRLLRALRPRCSRLSHLRHSKQS